MQNQQPLQNCHIILRLCAVEQGENLLIHKACQEKSQAGNVLKRRVELGFLYIYIYILLMQNKTMMMIMIASHFDFLLCHI